MWPESACLSKKVIIFLNCSFSKKFVKEVVGDGNNGPSNLHPIDCGVKENRGLVEVGKENDCIVVEI